MGEPVDRVTPQPEHNAPVEWALADSTGPVTVRATGVDDVAAVSRLDRRRLVSIEVPLHLAAAAWPEGVPLDVVLSEPAREAAHLYDLNPVARQRPVRVTVPGRAGLATAARIAMALQLPVRLLVVQPSPGLLAELHEVLDLYLHGPQTSAPVEFFQSALACALHGDAPPAWMALELDPDWFPRVDDADVHAWPPQRAGFVREHLAQLVSAGSECATCPFREWCQGYFKWPDAGYDCGGVKELLARVGESAVQLARDLNDAPSAGR